MNDIEKQIWISVFSACYAAYRNQSTRQDLSVTKRESDLVRAKKDADFAVKDLKIQGVAVFDENWHVNEIPF